MSVINKKYQFRGLDTRANKLYRQEGTASDCRNVFTDSNNNLIKRPDFEALNIPRGTDFSETGLFEDKLHFRAIIIDIMQYEDHLVIATKIPWGIPLVTNYVNKFYRFFEDTGVLEFIPFEKETYNSLDYGQIVNKSSSDIDGKFTKVNQEGILYFTGQYADSEVIEAFLPSDAFAAENNLSAVFTYDGEVIGRAGAPNSFNDTTTDLNIQNTNEYIRLLPIKLDAKGRHTFGNYSTHLGQNNGSSGSASIELTIPASTAVDRVYDYQAFFKTTFNGSLSSSDSAATRTIPAIIYNRQSEFRSVAKGQYLFLSLRLSVQLDASGNPFGSPKVTSITNNTVYRVLVEDVDYVGNTVTIGDFRDYNEDSGLFESTPSIVIRNDGIRGEAIFSNIIYAVYGSSDFAFGFKFKHYTAYAHNNSYDLFFSYYTPKGSSSLNTTTFSTKLLFISEDFEDVYDEDSVKLPPPKARQVADYLGALVLVDHENLYFSDFSVGGNIENFTPFDNFSVGSSKRGEITGVFANETFISVFREEEAYYVTGNIFLANYRVQSYQSTRIGCTDPKSIIDFRGAGLFLSKRGIYFCQQGGAMPEISDQIETIFTDGELDLDLDLTKCSSLVDFRREYIYFHIASTVATSGYVLAFDYNKNEWYLWDDIDGNSGFEMLEESIYYCDGADVYKEAATSTNSDAYYRSNFETLGEPSFIKKFLQVLLFTIDTTQSATIGIKTRRDWNENEIDTDQSKQVSAGQVDMTQRLNPKRSKSLAIEINSTSGNELILNGYEYEVEADVRMFKSDD